MRSIYAQSLYLYIFEINVGFACLFITATRVFSKLHKVRRVVLINVEVFLY